MLMKTDWAFWDGWVVGGLRSRHFCTIKLRKTNYPIPRGCGLGALSNHWCHFSGGRARAVQCCGGSHRVVASIDHEEDAATNEANVSHMDEVYLE